MVYDAVNCAGFDIMTIRYFQLEFNFFSFFSAILKFKQALIGCSLKIY